MQVGMNNTSWLIGQNPILAGGMVTTGDDYDLFLRKYLRCILAPVSSSCDRLHSTAMHETPSV